MSLLLWIILILFVLWLVGAFGSHVVSNAPQYGDGVHVLVVIAILLLVLHYVFHLL